MNDWELQRLVIFFNAHDDNGMIYWVCTGSGIETWINGVHVKLSACDSTNNMPFGTNVNDRYGPYGQVQLTVQQYELVKNWSGAETQQQLLHGMWQGNAPDDPSVESGYETEELCEEKTKINIRF